MSERYSVRHDTVASGNWFVCDSEDNNRATGMCTREADAQLHAIALNSVNAAAQPKPEGETVDVRVALAVDTHGDWYAAGWARGQDRDMMNAACNGVDGKETRSFLTYTVPVPTDPEVPEYPAIMEPAKEKK